MVSPSIQIATQVIGTTRLRVDDSPAKAIDEVVEASRADPVIVGTARMVRGGRTPLLVLH